METNRFNNSENGNLNVSRELLRFTGERMPEYRWLQDTSRSDKRSMTGQERHSESD